MKIVIQYQNHACLHGVQFVKKCIFIFIKFFSKPPPKKHNYYFFDQNIIISAQLQLYINQKSFLYNLLISLLKLQMHQKEKNTSDFLKILKMFLLIIYLIDFNINNHEVEQIYLQISRFGFLIASFYSFVFLQRKDTPFNGYIYNFRIV